MKKTTIAALCVSIFICTAKAQLPDYKTRINYLYAGINNKLSDKKTGLYYETTDSTKNENLHSWLWPLCALIQATNEMEALQPSQHYMQPVVNAIDQYYSDAPPRPGYQDYVLKERRSSRFYDDNQWIAIAYLDAYDRTHHKKYLDDAKLIYRFMMGGLDTAAGGGLYWKEGDKTTKNTCSNGPGILVALHLYKLTKQQDYLNTALALYKWTNACLQAPEGIYYDNIKIPSLKIAKAFYTYNTGTMLQANAQLYLLTHDKKYLTEAQRIAAAGKAHFFKNGRLPADYWFNAVMLRGYTELYKIDKNQGWLDFFKTDADNIWQQERGENNMLGPKPAKRLIDQAAMIEIYARLLGDGRY
ncbi:glycoside hydrolase family 76 protein [Mucilaginibacter sp. L3T2-6]|uniref:glycoside hydrolase family 76 protein n=1 Tax=Mucilaginibacter sp. L3T2-6 TaxID=3062491 RepID=UPI0026752208|nr:glycoside hydrolase family 76 protein [Mucilaginibacter sp. L3T2-6]MDO3643923.1 glycoside hydrolase family 76 protein [Mucilaginibacter sp. L3T2-6]MDV6216354.1 glycoside hydrolase family 76 protein [Mucilaginibacter sp. L3T2-6]